MRFMPRLTAMARPHYVQLSGYAQAANCTLALLEGRSHLVVPVVAMVAGSIVRGMNSLGPEYVPADVLANFPESFNGRPIVPIHPYDGTGSANEPATQNKYRYGQVFNSRTDDFDGNLKLDAWLDIERATALGGEPASVVADCQAGKLVEVSLGAWIVMAAEDGELADGRKYEYIWQYITSYDHLAMGLAGLAGACSVEVGCGGPRLYTAASADDAASDSAAESTADPAARRIILVGGPMRGKSTRAREYRETDNIPTYCTDPRSTVREPEDSVTYLPEGLSWSESSQYVADNWLSAPGPWCVEGHATARALRKMVRAGQADALQAVEIVVLEQAVSPTTPKQESMALSVSTVWSEIAPSFPAANVRSSLRAMISAPPTHTLTPPVLRSNALAKARRPTFSGTETTTWSAPSWHEWVTALHTGTESPKSISDATPALKSSIARHTLLGDPNAVTLRDLTLFPVVNPHSGKLNERALRAVLGGRGSAADIPDAAKSSAQSMARSLLKSEFDIEIAETPEVSDESESDTSDPKESANMAVPQSPEPEAVAAQADASATAPSTRDRSLFARMLAGITSLAASFRVNGGSTDGVSDTELRANLYTALRASEPAFGWGSYYWSSSDAIVDVFAAESTVVYVTCPYDDVIYWRQTYTVDSLGNVKLNGDREMVSPDWNWKPIPVVPAADVVDALDLDADTTVVVVTASSANANATPASTATALAAPPACGCHKNAPTLNSDPATGDPAAAPSELVSTGDLSLMAATPAVKTLVARLVANSSGVFTAESIPALESLPEPQLTAMCEKFAPIAAEATTTATLATTTAAVTEVAAPTPVANATTAASPAAEPEPFETFLSRSPTEFQAFYAQQKAAMDARKSALLTAISGKSKAAATMLTAAPVGIEQLEAVATELGCFTAAPIASYGAAGLPMPAPGASATAAPRYTPPKIYDRALAAMGKPGIGESAAAGTTATPKPN